MMKIAKIVACSGLLGLAAAADAGVVFYNGALTTSSPTFINPGGSGVGSPLGHYYDVWTITVDTSGSYIFETASPNVGGGNPSIALDTNMRVYANAFNPATPTVPAAQSSNDDFTGTLTVLPGPYGPNGVTTTATGFSGAQPSSRLTTTLNVGTTYFLVQTSFRRIDYVNTTDGGAKGNYFGGISGPGEITIVPAPASMALLGLGGMLAARRRRA